MIVCLIDDRETVGGWILDVPNDRMAVALKGQGVDARRRADRRANRRKRPPKGLIGYGVRKDIRQAAWRRRSAAGWAR